MGVLFGGTGKNMQYSDAIFVIDLRANNHCVQLQHVRCPSKDKFHAVLIQDEVHSFGLFNDVSHFVMNVEDLLPDISKIFVDENQEAKELEIKKEQNEKPSVVVVDLKKENEKKDLLIKQ